MLGDTIDAISHSALIVAVTLTQCHQQILTLLVWHQKMLSDSLIFYLAELFLKIRKITDKELTNPKSKLQAHIALK